MFTHSSATSVHAHAAMRGVNVVASGVKWRMNSSTGQLKLSLRFLLLFAEEHKTMYFG